MQEFATLTSSLVGSMLFFPSILALASNPTHQIWRSHLPCGGHLQGNLWSATLSDARTQQLILWEETALDQIVCDTLAHHGRSIHRSSKGQLGKMYFNWSAATPWGHNSSTARMPINALKGIISDLAANWYMHNAAGRTIATTTTTTNNPITMMLVVLKYSICFLLRCVRALCWAPVELHKKACTPGGVIVYPNFQALDQAGSSSILRSISTRSEKAKRWGLNLSTLSISYEEDGSWMIVDLLGTSIQRRLVANESETY